MDQSGEAWADMSIMQLISVSSLNCLGPCKCSDAESDAHDAHEGDSGAASAASLQGIPATAFSGVSGAQVSYTTLTSDPDANSTRSARIYAALTAHFVDTLFNSGDATLPQQVIANVNYAAIDECSSPDDYKWVFTRNRRDSSAMDVETCGSDHLPSEAEVVLGKGCYISVSAISAVTKTDVDATTQAAVLAQLQELPFSCYN